jgi:Ca2+-binding RTX toxin-like protein
MSNRVSRSNALAVLCRYSTQLRTRIAPVARASKLVIDALMRRQNDKSTPSSVNDRHAIPTQWRIESLEPRLLLSADAIPAVHLVVNDPTSGIGSTYIFNRGDGADWVDACFDASPNKLNTLQFGTDVSPTDIVARRVVDGQRGDKVALELAIAGTSDSVQLRSFFLDDDARNPSNPVQQVKFADGTVWNLSDILAQATKGTTADDALRGTVAAVTLQQGQAVVDTLAGLNGAVKLDAAAGVDVLDSGMGNTLYLFGKGDGQDTVLSYFDATPGKLNTLQFKTGVAPAEVSVARVADSQWGGNIALELAIAGTSDRITFNGFLYGGTPASDYNGLQRVSFADGTAWDISQLLFALGLGGTTGNDSISGTAAADLLNGAAGDDTLRGSGADDVIYGGAGDDSLYGEAGQDKLFGGAGDDMLNGADSNDVLVGGAGADTLYGQADNDTLDGGAGNDWLDGGDGNNTYLFGRGDGQDTVSFLEYGTMEELNTVQFKAGVLPSDVAARRVYDSQYDDITALELSIVGTSDHITVNFFYGDDPGNTYNPVQQLRFDDGTTWNIANILTELMRGTSANENIRATSGADEVNGQGGNDTIDGADGKDTISGGSGNDTLYGGADDDMLDGGSGNDWLDGGTGNNTYQFGRGDGQDTVGCSSDSTAGKLGTIQFKAGVLSTDVMVRRVYDSQQGGVNALELSIAGTEDRITVSYFFVGDDPAYGSSYYNPVQQVRFDDGKVWNIGALLAELGRGTDTDNVVRGSTGADTLNGEGGNDTLNGGSGNDALYGESGNDTLDGGSGNDWLDGGTGLNTYLFGRGDGQDTISYVNDSSAGKLGQPAQTSLGGKPGRLGQGRRRRRRRPGAGHQPATARWPARHRWRHAGGAAQRAHGPAGAAVAGLVAAGAVGGQPGAQPARCAVAGVDGPCRRTRQPARGGAGMGQPHGSLGTCRSAGRRRRPGAGAVRSAPAHAALVGGCGYGLGREGVDSGAGSGRDRTARAGRNAGGRPR